MAKRIKKTVKEDSSKTGARSILTDELIERIGSFIEKGNFYSTTIKAVGIAEMTFYTWKRRGLELIEEGKKGSSTFEKQCIKLVHALNEAEAKAEAKHVENINKHSLDDWKASAWYLERKHNERWGRKETTKLEGGLTNTNANIDLSQLSDDEIEALLKKFE